MVKVIKQIVPKEKYGIKCPYTMKPTRIVVHNTYNDASARNEIAYMTRNNNEVSFQYAVDDIEAVQGIEENRNSWNAGDGHGKGNREGIAIEICYSKSGGDRFIKAEQNAVELIVDILKRYGWGIDKVTKHQDYNGKYCPHRTLDMGWNRFLKMIEDKLNSYTPSPTTTSKSSTPTLKYSKDDKIILNGYLYRDSYGNGRGAKKTNYKGTITIVNAKGSKPYHIDSIGWVAESDIKKQSSSNAVTPIKVGDKVKVKKGAKSYEGVNIASFVYNNTYRVDQLKGNRAVLDLTGICTAFNVNDLIK